MTSGLWAQHATGCATLLTLLSDCRKEHYKAGIKFLIGPQLTSENSKFRKSVDVIRGMSGESYEVLQKAYGLSKEGWSKLKAYPVLCSVLPAAESTASYCLEKAGTNLTSLENDVISPTLVTLDQKYVSKVAHLSVEKYDSVVKAAEGMGSRKDVVDGYKDKTKDAVVYAKDVVVVKYDATKEAVLGAYTTAKSTVVDTIYPQASPDTQEQLAIPE